MMATALVLATLLLTSQASSPPDPRVKKQRAEAMQHYRAGLKHLGSEHFEKAAEEFRAAIALDSLLVMAHYSLGQAHMSMKDYQSAVSSYRGCQQAYREVAALQQNQELRAQEQREDSVRELKDAIRELQYRLGQRISDTERMQIQQRILGIETSIAALQQLRGLGLGADAVPAEFSLALGSALFRAGQIVEAEGEYREALKVNPKYGEVHNNLAVICMMSGRLDEAEEHVKAAEKAGLKVSREFKEELGRRRQAQ